MGEFFDAVSRSTGLMHVTLDYCSAPFTSDPISAISSDIRTLTLRLNSGVEYHAMKCCFETLTLSSLIELEVTVDDGYGYDADWPLLSFLPFIHRSHFGLQKLVIIDFPTLLDTTLVSNPENLPTLAHLHVEEPFEPAIRVSGTLATVTTQLVQRLQAKSMAARNRGIEALAVIENC
jgi:hypothetical protein